MKNHNLLLIGVLLQVCLMSCKQSASENALQETTDGTTLSDMSVFQLSSSWVTQDKDSIRLSDLRGRVLVVAMIYTTCQFACPRLVADMKTIEEGIGPEKMEDVNIVLISINPERDLPDTLRIFAEDQQLDTRYWTLLNGAPDDVLEFAAVLGVKYKKVTPLDFSHSNIISIFDKKGDLIYQQEGYGTGATDETIQQVLQLTSPSL